MKSSCGSLTSSSSRTVKPPTPESNTAIGRPRGSDPADELSMHAIIPERYGRGTVRALVVSNMLPDRTHPGRGRFVRDQVAALRRLDGLDVELFEFPPGPRAIARAP